MHNGVQAKRHVSIENKRNNNNYYYMLKLVFDFDFNRNNELKKKS